ncbi:hypothetical protein, partial [Actinokineospora spheciospongiae]|uniref:hypothetical protein n=1 Tax=Actinokineospora spheciospongiae TaxID=909613 RepID=UPI000D9C9F42
DRSPGLVRQLTTSDHTPSSAHDHGKDPQDTPYNGVPDVGLITKQSGGAVTVRHFLNDGAAGFTELP